MENWQYEYAIELLQKGRAAIEKEKQKLEENIKCYDKRTYNGRMFAIFDRAHLLVVEKLLQI